MSVEDTEVKLALMITSALVHKDAGKLIEAVTEFMTLHDLVVEQRLVKQIPIKGKHGRRDE